MTTKKMRFYSIKNDDGSYSGTFIADSVESAIDLAVKNKFIENGDNVNMEDITVEMSNIDKQNRRVVDGT